MMDGSDDSDTVSLVPINMLITNINLPWVEAQYIQNIYFFVYCMMI